MKKSLSPKSEAELSSLVKQAAASKTSLEIVGGGTRPIGNPIVTDSFVSTNKISGVSLYEPGALTIVANAGTSLEDLQKELTKENQHLPFEPSNFTKLLHSKGAPTIGSVIATANSGPRRIQAGAARDALIGVRFVSGEGEIIKNGGRVMKNVTGYDLVKLLCGSYGTLGILTEVSFKVLPMPETAATILVNGLDDEKAISVLSSALCSPFDVTGAAHTPNGVDGEPVTMIRLEGFSKSIAYRTQKLKERIASLLVGKSEISIETNAKNVSAGWKWVRDLESFVEKKGAVWKVSVKPSDGPLLVSKLKETLELDVLYDWGGGLVWLLDAASTKTSANQIRETVKIFKGYSTLIRAETALRREIEAFQPEHPRLVELSENIRRQFDPIGILNPNKMLRRTA